ncbi:MAG: hypothetical protein K1Y36_18425 [Blastocatellia bacterium]|nr:hypothetical protein [Blastocatellia bacterium]
MNSETLQPMTETPAPPLNAKVLDAINTCLPKIKQVFQEKVKPGARVAMQNDELFRPVCAMAYSTLPFPVRLFVKEDTFISFCFTHRDKLLQPAETEAAA